MRFTPMTHMQSGEVCFQVEPDHNGVTNGILSGSFLSGSEHWNYLEFRSPSRLTTQTYSLEVIQGYTENARLYIIGGGAGGGATGCTVAGGGGGGAGEVKVINNLNLYATRDYTIQVGGAGQVADPCAGVGPTKDGDNGAQSRFYFTPDLNITADGGEGGFGDSANPDGSNGGDSGNGFDGGLDQGAANGGGGAGASEDGEDAPSGLNEGGDGGDGVYLNFPYTSPTFSSSGNVGVAGGGGGGGVQDSGEGQVIYGGGEGARQTTGGGADAGENHKGAGAGGGNNGADTSISGGSGIVVFMYQTGSCP
jgi:hypothetical protein